jgi:phosphodiesterase/alkaline phosphatase D-like protein
MSLLDTRQHRARVQARQVGDAYLVARQRLLDLFASGRVANPVVITGDLHDSWVVLSVLSHRCLAQHGQKRAQLG